MCLYFKLQNGILFSFKKKKKKNPQYKTMWKNLQDIILNEINTDTEIQTLHDLTYIYNVK